MSTRPNLSMSDRRLRALLKQLRETPAAPQDFRARVLGRLADDGLLLAAAAPKASLLGRLSAWLRPLPLGLAATCVLALILVLRPAPAPRPALVQAAAASPVRAHVRIPAAAPALAERHAVQSRPAVVVASPAVAEPAPAQAVAVAQQPVQSQASEAVGAAAQPKAEAVVQVVGLAATPIASNQDVSKPYPGQASEVRNNVVRVSSGDPSLAFADVHFSFATSGHVRVDVLDRLGRTVAVLFDGQMAWGEYDGGTKAPGALPCQWCLWNNLTVSGDTAASGIYLVRIQTPDYVHIHKLMLIK